MDIMTEDALTMLWEAEQRARRFENDFWKTADLLLEQGLVRIEDIAEIYGVHPHTARKRLHAWRLRIPARQAQQVIATDDLLEWDAQLKGEPF